MSLEEQAVLQHFKKSHHRDDQGRFIVPLPIKENAPQLGESRTMAVKRQLALERSLKAKGQYREYLDTMQEYFDKGHAQPIPASEKSCEEVYYIPMQAIRKESTSPSKMCVVFDASAKTTSAVVIITFIHRPFPVQLVHMADRFSISADKMADRKRATSGCITSATKQTK